MSKRFLEYMSFNGPAVCWDNNKLSYPFKRLEFLTRRVLDKHGGLLCEEEEGEGSALEFYADEVVASD